VKPTPFICVWLFAACGGGDAKPTIDAAVDSVPIDAAVLRSVNGTFKIHWVGTSGDTDQVLDLSTFPIAAVVGPDFTTIPGVGAPDSTFRIDGVPEGTYYVKLGTSYFEESGDSVDLSASLIGRPDVIHTTTSTYVTFDVTGLAGWQATDELQMSSAQTGGMAYGMEKVASTGVPAAADTALTGFTYDINLASDRALADGAAGDLLTLAQLSTQNDGARTYRTVSRTFTPAPFTITPGDTKMLSGAFTTIDPSKMLDLVWDRPAFSAELATHGGGLAAENWSTFAISTIPEGATRGYYDDTPDVVVYAPGYSTDTTAVSAKWAYGDPYPAAWTRIAWLRFWRYRFIQLPGAQPLAVYARLFAYQDLASLPAGTSIEPLVGLVVNPLVSGMPAGGAGTVGGVGTTPIVSWSAPTIGTANRYQLIVDNVTVQSGATALKRVALFDTSRTQVEIPPGS
jgi:hypothetical protein